MFLNKLRVPTMAAVCVDEKRISSADLHVGGEAWLKMECEELFMFYSHKCFESLLKSTKSSLELLRKRCLMSR